MSEVWAIIVSVIILLIVYGMISSKLEERKKRRIREKSLPSIQDLPTIGIRYNIHLSDGRKLLNAEMLGTVEGGDPNFSFAGYDGMLVILSGNREEAYIRKSSIRYVEEI